jgi:membrane-bound lytic murein transglycosylase D
MKKFILFSIIMALSICGCSKADVAVKNLSHVKNVERKVNIPLTHIEVKQMNVKSSALVIPSGYMKIKCTYQHTKYIGTIDHPTINGGIISSSESASLSHIEPCEIVSNIQPVTAPADHPSDKVSFQDSWATNEKVKRLLVNAADQGKLDYVLKKADQMGLPASIAIIPMVESQYRTNAVSPKGAAGAWQLMPSVAKDYGLSSHDRFRFSSSTDTALKLISSLHDQFNNWDLSFAAYNAGSKRVMNALHKNPLAKNINDLDLPQETKEYVRRLKSINYILGVMDARET